MNVDHEPIQKNALRIVIRDLSDVLRESGLLPVTAQDVAESIAYAPELAGRLVPILNAVIGIHRGKELRDDNS